MSIPFKLSDSIVHRKRVSSLVPLLVINIQFKIIKELIHRDSTVNKGNVETFLKAEVANLTIIYR